MQRRPKKHDADSDDPPAETKRKIPFCVKFAWGPILFIVTPAVYMIGQMRTVDECPVFHRGPGEWATNHRKDLLKREDEAFELLPTLPDRLTAIIKLRLDHHEHDTNELGVCPARTQTPVFTRHASNQRSNLGDNR